MRCLASDGLAELYERGRRGWPQLSVPFDSFAARVSRAVEHEDDPQAAMVDLRAEELYLACACAQGDERGIAAFKTSYEGWLTSTLLQMGYSAESADDILQQVWIRLFVRVSARAAKIETFSGRGSLAGWLRTLTIRVALDELRPARSRPLLETLEESLVLAGPDPEIEYFKRTYQHEFKRALDDALRSLSAEERNLLQRYFIDGLSSDELASLMHIHRSTVARQLHRARTQLFIETRRLMAAHLKVDRTLIDSILRLLHSRMELEEDELV